MAFDKRLSQFAVLMPVGHEVNRLLIAVQRSAARDTLLYSHGAA
jgi:hypothetical protein